MAQQVYNVGIEATDVLIKNINPIETTTSESDALEYNTAPEAASVANYLNGLNNGTTYVVVGPHPKPHH
jgi:hypothetical protein